MRILVGVLCLLFSVLTVQADKVINLKEHGVDTLRDVTPLVYELLREHNGKNITLSFPKGEYHFYPDQAIGKYHPITNHDNIYRYFAFPLINSENVTIDGNGSDFIFHGIITPFVIENSKNITLKNFSIDWEEPFYVQMKVLASDAKNHTMNVEVDNESVYKFEGNRLALTANGFYNAFLGENMVFNPKTMAVAYKAQHHLIFGDNTKYLEAKRIGKDRYTLKGKFIKSPAPKGMVYIFKGMNRANRYSPGMHVIDSDGFKAEDINIHHAGGMGIIGEKSKNIHLNRFNVVLREGTSRMVTTTADATHFCNCGGDLLIENCTFENMLDDATNVHGTYMRICSIEGSHTLRANLRHPQQTDYGFGSKGDEIQFVEDETILPISKNEIAEVTKINQGLYELRFKKQLPKSLKAGDGVENLSWYPTFTFRNNIVRNNRARGILVSSPRPTLIENNSFSSMMTGILLEGDLKHWHESGAVKDVVIRNNHFKDCAYGGGKGSIIWVNPQMRKLVDGKCYEENIIIENNLFETFDKSLVNAKSTKGLIFRNNTINPSKTYKPIWGDMPHVNLENCVNAQVKGNKYKGEGQLEIKADGVSKKTLKR